MSDTKDISEIEAIRNVISDGGAMDYVDVVEIVRKKFGIKVSAMRVEEVHLAMPRETRIHVEPRLRMDISAPTTQTEPDLEHKPDRENVAAVVSRPGASGPHLVEALQFVKSVDGLANAKAALAELESIIGNDA